MADGHYDYPREPAEPEWIGTVTIKVARDAGQQSVATTWLDESDQREVEELALVALLARRYG